MWNLVLAASLSSSHTRVNRQNNKTGSQVTTLLWTELPSQLSWEQWQWLVCNSTMRLRSLSSWAWGPPPLIKTQWAESGAPLPHLQNATPSLCFLVMVSALRSSPSPPTSSSLPPLSKVPSFPYHICSYQLYNS